MNDLKELIGKKIAKIRPMTAKELDDEGWERTHSATSAIELEDGTVIYPSQDDEGNGAGVLFGKDNKGKHFYVYDPKVIQ